MDTVTLKKRRVKNRTETKIMLSSSLPRLTRTHTTRRLTEETPVTSCMLRLTCGLPLPRTRCQLWKSFVGAIEELTPGVTDHRRIPATSVERNAPFSSRQAACQKQIDDESLQGESRIHEEKSMSSIPPNNVSTDEVRVNERTRRTTF